MREEAFLFACGVDSLPGVITRPDDDHTTRLGLLVVVGGPQYRVGSHRQFVLLSRALALRGIPSMRFDYRGMGDGEGARVAFDSVQEDIKAAVDEFMARCPGLEGVVTWGLCDGASATSLYAPNDPRVVGLVLLNPWVRTEAGEAQTYLKRYYLRRVFDPGFWRKLLSGGVSVLHSLSSFSGMLKRARQTAPSEAAGALPDRMATCLVRADKPLLFILSGRDFVADEFRSRVEADANWQTLTSRNRVVEMDEADHTFSSAVLRDRVAVETVRWMNEFADRSKLGS